MDGQGTDPEDVDREIATAVGVLALSNATLAQAAAAVDVPGWRLENAIEEAGLADAFGITDDGDVAAEIDDLLDGDG